jgi:hypothetical protein
MLAHLLAMAAQHGREACSARKRTCSSCANASARERCSAAAGNTYASKQPLHGTHLLELRIRRRA